MWQRVIIVVIFAVLALLAVVSHAQTFPPNSGYTWACQTNCPSGMNNSGHTTPEAACAAVAAQLAVQAPQHTWGVLSVTMNGANDAECKVSQNGSYSWPDRNLVRQQTSGCPSNSSGVGAQCQCDAGYTAQTSGGSTSCVPQSNCPASGTERIVNVTEGYARTSTPGNSDWTIDYPPVSLPVCSGGCQYTAPAGQTAESVACFRSQQPASNGLHRISCDYRLQSNGQSCTSASDRTDPQANPPPCPGTLGSVNGQPVCVNPLNAPASPPTNTAPSPEQMGNPAAGTMPSSGQGSGTGPSGRTPTSGDGGEGGGGSSSIIPGGGSTGNGQVATGTSGSGQNPTGKDPCGLPDTPPCRLNEAGTPDGQGAYTGASSELDAAAEALKGTIEGLNGGGGERTALPWVWGISLPASSCSAFTWSTGARTITVNPCESSGVQLVRSMLAFFWAAVGGLYAWRSVIETTGGK